MGNGSGPGRHPIWHVTHVPTSATGRRDGDRPGIGPHHPCGRTGNTTNRPTLHTPTTHQHRPTEATHRRTPRARPRRRPRRSVRPQLRQHETLRLRHRRPPPHLLGQHRRRQPRTRRPPRRLHRCTPRSRHSRPRLHQPRRSRRLGRVGTRHRPEQPRPKPASLGQRIHRLPHQNRPRPRRGHPRHHRRHRPLLRLTGAATPRRIRLLRHPPLPRSLVLQLQLRPEHRQIQNPHPPGVPPESNRTHRGRTVHLPRYHPFQQQP